MHYIYAGYEESLNRRSFKEHEQIYIIKIGYCQEVETWEDRFNDGFKDKKTGDTLSLPLALCRGWQRIATVEAGNWNRASPGIEKQLLRWTNERFGSVHLMPNLIKEVEEAHRMWKPGTTINKNGLGELRYIAAAAVSDFEFIKDEHRFNDSLAQELIVRLGNFLTSQLRLFAKTLNLG